MPRLVLLNKPYGMLCQFRDHEGRATLAELDVPPGLYPAGRLDADSEGLLVLTDDGALQHRITDPRHKLPKTYWVQIEGVPSREALDALRRGVALNDGRTRPARVRAIAAPRLWPRTPPIRERSAIPTHWLELTITEGRNRQVRRMTAAVELPTLRLVRVRIGPFDLARLAPGEWREIAPPRELAGRSRTSRGRAGRPVTNRTSPRIRIEPQAPAAAPSRHGGVS
ncbi:MAG TPA: pseudouridine synthase [Candidatus Sulfotelmatobacter sp.]|nr:pseudouridine synthase [Candidatus Sulfotelmatobacter sp.]